MAYNKDTNWENEKKYLDSLAQSGNAGERAWAEQQKKVLASEQAKYTSSSNTSSGTTSSGGSTSNGGSSSGGSSSKGTSSGGNSQYTPSQYKYTIGSDAGKQIAQDMGIGQTYTASDGSVWTKNNDGTITVNHKGVVTNNAYTPTDYGILGQQQMEAGLGWQDVQKTYNARQNKALTTDGLGQYANDDLQQAMWDYIQEAKAAEAKQNAQTGTANWEINFTSANPKPTQTASKYDPQIEKLLNEILNRDDFSYDVASDPLYQQYEAIYQREGDRAMREAMANAAASAGGMNTWAITAAQQAANSYAAQLGDKIPELYQLAYSMYLDDKASKVEDLGILQNLDATQYARYRDTMADWQNDRNFAYGMYQDAVQQGNWQTQFDYNAMVDDRNFNYDSYWANKNYDTQQEQQALENSWVEREWENMLQQQAIENSRNETEYNDKKEQQALENSWAETEYGDNKAQEEKEQAKSDVELYIKLGVMPDAELIAKAGMNADTVRSAVNSVIASNTKITQGGSGGKSSETKDNETKDNETKDNETSGSYFGTMFGNIKENAHTYSEVKKVCDELFEEGGYESVHEALIDARRSGVIDQGMYKALMSVYEKKE